MASLSRRAVIELLITRPLLAQKCVRSGSPCVPQIFSLPDHVDEANHHRSEFFSRHYQILISTLPVIHFFFNHHLSGEISR